MNYEAWQEVNLNERYLILHTRKKKGGHVNRTTAAIYLHSIGDAERNGVDALNRQIQSHFSEKFPHLKK